MKEEKLILLKIIDDCYHCNLYCHKSNANIYESINIGSKYSSGFDVRSTEKHVISPQQIQIVKTGLYIYSGTFGRQANMIPDIQIRSRSGLASKGLIVANQPATIDFDYKGEIGVILYNISNEVKNIEIGDRIAQIVISECFLPSRFIPNSQNLKEREDGGFGSTGVK